MDTIDRIVAARQEVSTIVKAGIPLVLIDKERLVELDDQVVGDGYFLHINLAETTYGDYRRILKAIADGCEGLVFTNADIIANTDDREDLEHLLYFALKHDTIPYGNDEIDFGKIRRIVVACSEFPEYLRGKLDGAFVIDTASDNPIA